MATRDHVCVIVNSYNKNWILNVDRSCACHDQAHCQVSVNLNATIYCIAMCVAGDNILNSQMSTGPNTHHRLHPPENWTTILRIHEEPYSQFPCVTNWRRIFHLQPTHFPETDNPNSQEHCLVHSHCSRRKIPKPQKKSLYCYLDIYSYSRNSLITFTKNYKYII